MLFLLDGGSEILDNSRKYRVLVAFKDLSGNKSPVRLQGRFWEFDIIFSYRLDQVNFFCLGESVWRGFKRPTRHISVGSLDVHKIHVGREQSKVML